MKNLHCTVNDCDNKHKARGFCAKHYRRFNLYGNPLATAPKKSIAQCSIDYCDKPSTCRGWCNVHYQMWIRHGDPTSRHIPNREKECQVDSCSRHVYGHDMCSKHYQRWARHGDPTKVEQRKYEPKLTPGGYIRIWLSNDDPMYCMTGRNDSRVLEHRLVMARYIGRPLERHETVHHIDGVRSNNNIENLQLFSGNHGRGSSSICHDCGSYNIGPAAIATTPKD